MLSPCVLHSTLFAHHSQVIKAVIILTLALTVVVFVTQTAQSGPPIKYHNTLIMCLSLIIGAVPIALPLVIQGYSNHDTNAMSNLPQPQSYLQPNRNPDLRHHDD